MSELKLKTCRRGHEYVPRTKDCPQCQSIRAKKWAEENAELIKLRDKARHRERKVNGYYELHPSYVDIPAKREYRREYGSKHKAKLNEYAKTRNAIDRIECPLFKLKGQIRTLVYQAFRTRGFKKNDRTEKILGCSFEFFQTHLKKTATDRYGFWCRDKSYHIDHIVPLITATTIEKLIELNHYTNLQLLYPEDNLRKGTKICY